MMSFRVLAATVLAAIGAGNADASAWQPAQDKVWVNPSSSVYHCPDSRYWSNTKRGLLMTEDAAVEAGHRPAGGKSCGLRSTKRADSTSTRRGLIAEDVDPENRVTVWVNTSSGVFHCAGSRFYGNTKRGRYLDQAAARAAGYRPAGGQSCQAPPR